MEDRRVSYRNLMRKTGERDHFINLGIEERMILRWISIKWDGAWTKLI
jgi:hypothetical protein